MYRNGDITLSEKIRELLNKRGISIAAFAEMCDLPLETVRNIYYGRTADPKVSTLLKMGKALNLSVNYLMGEYTLTKEEMGIIEHYRLCGSHGKSIISLVAKYEAVSAREEREKPNKHRVPCLIAKGNIHEGIAYEECEVFEVETTEEDAFVAIELTTNDLVPVYCKGDILLMANRFPKNREYGVFYEGARAYIRQFLEEDGRYYLHCVHGMSEDVVLKRLDEVEYIGTCIGVIRV